MIRIFTLYIFLFIVNYGYSQVPPNDDCANAIQLNNVNNFCGNQLFGSPTFDLADGPCPPTFNPALNTWFRFTAVGHTVTIGAVAGANLYKITLIRFPFGTCAIPEILDCNLSSLTFNGLTIGEEYYIVISSDQPSANFELCVNNPVPVPPPNDIACDAIVLNHNVQTCGTTVDADFEFVPFTTPCPAVATNQIWYRVTIPANQSNLAINFQGNSLMSGIQVILGQWEDGCGGFTFNYNDLNVFCGPSSSTFEFNCLEPGTYHIVLSSNNPGAGTFCLTPNIYGPPSGCAQNDNCENATKVPPFAINADPVCVSGCNIGACGENITSDGCNYNGSVVWFEVTIPADASKLNITLNSIDGSLLYPQMQLFSGDCSNLTAVTGCNSGANGILNLLGVDVVENTTYYIAVGNNTGFAGNFNLCFSATDPSTACVSRSGISPTSRSSGLPLNAPLLPGETVNFQFSFVFSSTNNSCQWPHGVVPIFGSCWDVEASGLENNFNGNFLWFNGTVTYKAENPFIKIYTDPYGVVKLCYYVDPTCMGDPLTDGTRLPAGWFYVNGGGPCLDQSDPNQSYGLDCDGCESECSVVFNFSLVTKSLEECEADPGILDCGIQMFVFSDRQTGCWEGGGDNTCLADFPTYFQASLNCCRPPTIVEEYEKICSGYTTNLEITSDQDDQGAVYAWTINAPNGIAGAAAGNGKFIRQTLTNSTPNILTVEYIITGISATGCPGEPYKHMVDVLPEIKAVITTNPIDGRGCASTPFDVFANATGGNGGPYEYLWSYQQSTDQNLLGITPGQEGIFPYTVTVTDIENGCTGTTSVVVTVSPKVDVFFEMDTSEFCAQNGPVQLDVVTLTNVVSYDWSVPFGPTPNAGASTISIPQNINNVTDLLSGLFQVTITDDNGCTGNTEIDVSVFPTPRFYVNGVAPEEICVTDELIASGDPIDFENIWLVLAESGSQYNWSGSALPIGGKVYPADLLTLSGPGRYNVKLVVISPANCIDSIEHEFDLLIPRELDLSVPSPLCATAAPQTLTGNPGGGIWSGPGVNNGLFNPAAVGAGTYKVFYEFTEGTCISRDSMNILVEEPPTIQLDAITPKCFDADPVQLTGSPAGGTWTSLTPGLLDANSFFDPKLVPAAGVYQFGYTVIENGCSFTDTLDIEVYPQLRADFQFISPVCLTGTSTIQFNGIAPSGTNYVWTIPNGNITANDNNGQITVQWNVSGSQDIILSIDINGCNNGPITKTIIVERPLDDPEPDCGTLSTTSVAFDWDDITGASGYIVNYGGTDFPQSTSDYSVTGLTPPGGEIPVTITVTAVGTGVCGNSNPVTIECISIPCPVITLNPSNPVLDFCVSSTTPPIQLTMAKTGGDDSGTGIWTGPFVSDSGSFDAASAGAGQYTFTYTYTEASCDYTGSVTLNLVEGSSPDWASDKLEVCIDEVVTITYTGNNLNGGALIWNFNGGTELPGSTDNIKLISWPSAGIKNVSVFVEDALCTPEVFTATIEVEAPLPIPNVTCGADPVSVTFTWDPIPGVIQYLISIDGGPYLPYDQTTYIISGLSQGDPSIEIRVIAVNSGPCGNSGIGTASCAPKPCVPIDVVINPVTAICLTSATGPQQLSATASGSNGSGTYSWSGPGITNASTGSFDPNIAGLGIHTIDLRFNEDFCNYFAQIVLQVLEVPTADFTIIGPICIDESVRVSHSGNAGAGATFNWTVNGGNITAGANTPNIDVQWATAGVKSVTLLVTQNGCSSDPVTMNITVEAPLPAPLISCSSSTTEVEFTWNPVTGATGYLVIINGGASYTTTDLSALVDGLTVGQVVTISVTAIAPAGYSCGNSVTSSLVCEAEQCPMIFVDIAEEDFICLKSNSPLISLDVDLTGEVVSGSGQWAGGAGLTDDQLGIFDPKLAGIGTHEIVYVYREKACNYYDTINIEVRQQPIADFTATSPLCIDEIGNVQFTGTATSQGELLWDLDGANIISGTGTSDLEVSWSASGDKNLELIIEDNGCTSEPITKIVQVDRPLAAPILNCNSTLTSISFSWNNVGTEGYLVSIDGAPATFISANNIDLQDLITGDSVSITVVAIDSGPCGNSPAGEITCYAVNCPDIDLTIDPQPTLCITEIGNTVKLTGNATGGFGGGNYNWSGPGIVNAADGQFDPTLAGPGDHEVFVTYRETVCPYQTSTIITVTESPSLVMEATDATCFGFKDGFIAVEDITGGTAPYTFSMNGSVHSDLNRFENLGQGSYVVEVRDANGCQQSFPVIIQHPDRVIVDLGANILMETGDTVQLAPILNFAPDASTIYWWTGDESIDCATCPVIHISPADQTTIRVEVTDSSGCKGADDISITVKKKRRVFIPAAFSPNGDGINDVFFVNGGIEVAGIESMRVFNRWGDEVFVNEEFLPNVESEGWDGLHRGEVLNPSVFVYRIVIRFVDGSKENYYGDVSLLKTNGY